MTIDAAIAMNRFGLGTKVGQMLPDKPQNWLLDQLARYQARPLPIVSQPSRVEIAAQFDDYQMAARNAKRVKNDLSENSDMAEKVDATRKAYRRDLREIYGDAVQARLNAALQSETDFAERLVHFWSNHFAISTDKLPVAAFAGSYEFEAIRPHIMGKFSDLLFAITNHPAMLVFLDQTASIGPSSPVAKRAANRRGKKIGLNENLAREILELHTLGVRTGYSQNDVTELARALTGRTVNGMARGQMVKRLLSRPAQPGETIFLDQLHEPGTRQVLGKTYGQPGAVQAQAILTDLAVHPATARHIATKLAKHFVTDTPPASIVAKLEANFLKTGGDLPSLYRTLVEAPEAWPDKWNGAEAKFKSPWEWVISSLRALDLSELPGNQRISQVFVQLGQPIWKPSSPAGYADSADAWAGSAALMRRVELSARLSRLSAGRVDARALAPQILPGTLTGNTAEAIARAASLSQGLSLLLVSPEFMRR